MTQPPVSPEIYAAAHTQSGMATSERARRDAQSIRLDQVTRCSCGAWGWIPRGCCDLCGLSLPDYVMRMAG